MTAQHAPAPTWLDGFVDVLQARRRTWIAAAIAIVLVGALLALLAPSFLPPTLVVGIGVGIAAALLATAIVLALDSADLVVRGPRHVVAAGGHVAGTISRSPGDIDALMRLIDSHGGDGGVRVALTPASRSAGVPGARANMVAEELARRELKVLCTDLTRGRTPAVGLSDVLSGERKLADAVRFDEELFLAHLAIGSEPEAALAGFADWANALPSDLDVLVAALPPLAEPGVLPAVQGVELVLVLVEVDRTERVDLIACLDAIDAAGVPAALILVDPELETTVASSTSVAVIGGSAATPVAGADPEPRTIDLVDPEVVAEAAPMDDGDPLPPDDDFDDEVDDEADGAILEPSPDRGDRVAGASVAAGGGTGVAGASAAAGAGAAGAALAGAAAGATVSDAAGPASSDEFDDDDDVAPPVPGGGHVRTVRRRGQGAGAGAASSAPARAPSPSTATPAGTTTSPVAGGDDDIDETAREAARITASLHTLASEVWQRDDE